MPLEKNQEIELAITGMSAQGSGVGRWVQEDGGPGLACSSPLRLWAIGSAAISSRCRKPMPSAG